MRSNVEVLDNQSHMADMKQKDLHQQAVTFTACESADRKAQIKTLSPHQNTQQAAKHDNYYRAWSDLFCKRKRLT